MSAHNDIFTQVLLGLSSVVSGLAWRGNLKAARRSEDIPTSKVRSAAQGYAEFVGYARMPPGEVMLSPLTQTRCVWWHYTISYPDSHSNTVNIEEKTSSRYFGLDDGTGVCMVNPVGADMRASQARRWIATEGQPLAQAATIGFADIQARYYQCTETVLLASARLYVLGEFQTYRVQTQPLDRMSEKVRAWLADGKLRQPFDTNTDGKIDESELASMRKAALLDARREVATEIGARDMIGKPRDGRPFIISSSSQARIVSDDRAGSVLWLIWCILSAILTLALIRYDF